MAKRPPKSKLRDIIQERKSMSVHATETQRWKTSDTQSWCYTGPSVADLLRTLADDLDLGERELMAINVRPYKTPECGARIEWEATVVTAEL